MSASASSVVTPGESYARIRNPRLLFVVRLILLAVFILITVTGMVSLPANFRDYRDLIASQPDTIRDLSNLGISVEVGALYGFVLTFVEALAFTVAGLIIFVYRSDDWVAILAACILVGNGVGGLIYAHSGLSFLGLILVIQPVLAWLTIFPFLCLFPDGRFIPRWSRWLVPIYFVLCLPLISVNYLYWERGISIGDTARLGVALLMGLFWCVGTGFLLIRLRRTAIAAQRQQIKQMFAGMLAVIFANLIFPLLTLVPVIGTGALVNVILLPLVANIGTMFMAVSVTFAILRYRLWDIDLILNQGVVYISAFIVLVLIFIGIVLTLQTGLEAVLGPQQTTLAAMLSAGTVAVLFNPTRVRLQPVIDRWMFGLRFDLNAVGAEKRIGESKAHPGAITTLNETHLGIYEFKDLIGRGGMGEVYLGVQSTLKRQVAIKVLLPHLSLNSEFRVRFERESRIVAGLHHPNIITIFDYGEMNGVYYMVMEYIQGPDLAEFLRGRALSLTEALPLMTKIAEALDYAHAQGIVHRDIKPSNIMLKQSSNSLEAPHPILMDFGLTKLADSNSGFTQSGPLGTLAYMAPEQISAAHEADYRADIYAFGIMCYQMLTGKLPFSSNNQAALLFAHLHKPAPDPRLIQPELPLPASSAILRALDKLPDNRPQSAGLFVAELSANS